MLTLLEKWFIPNNDNTQSPTVRHAYGVLCSVMGICFNILLFTLKLFAGFISNSIAIMADAVNNLSDAGSSIITLIGFKLAAQKPDSDHPFGHGRMEYLSGLFVAIIIMFMGIELMQSSLQKILHPEALNFSLTIVVILIISILVKCYMAYYNRKVGKKINSSAMLATSTDSLSDTISTTVVLIATLVNYFTDLSIDGYCGILVGLFILFAGINAAKDTINPLLGMAPEPEFVQQIENIVMSDDMIIGIHDLMVHNYGPGRTLISLHAEVPADGDLIQMHDTIDLLEHKLRDELLCQAVIHMDPICIHDDLTNELKQMVHTLLEKIDPQLTMHDFRIVTGPTHTNLIFDVVTPYQYKYSDEELNRMICRKISEQNDRYFAVIEIDKKYA